MNALAKFFGLNSQDNVVSISAMDLKKEDPSLAQRRDEVRNRMKSFGRTPMLQGGKFSRHVTVLQPHNR